VALSDRPGALSQLLGTRKSFPDDTVATGPRVESTSNVKESICTLSTSPSHRRLAYLSAPRSGSGAGKDGV
jgi:hypothetical protein